MLTRLKINGFKTLIDVDVRFGPFTCIAGGNGVGKSNLFDAIQFLSYLAEKPLVEAANLIRNKDGNGTLQSIFHKSGDDYVDTIEIEADMIIPKVGVDELGQEIKAEFNYLRYSLVLSHVPNEYFEIPFGSLKIVSEELTPLKLNEESLFFNNKADWKKNIIIPSNYQKLMYKEGDLLIVDHEDTQYIYSSGKLKRTLLSLLSIPTFLLAKQEMKSWSLLQLEPSKLRSPDKLSSVDQNIPIGNDGSHLPLTVFRLATQKPTIFAQITNRLSELIDGIKEIQLDKDDKRQLLALNVMGNDGTILPIHSLSDGTLRFLALAVLEQDYTDTGLICLEEPENGIHPNRIPAIIDLLRNIPVDTEEEVNEDNPIRQVIVNTHSPKVVAEVPAESLLFAELREVVKGGKRFKATSFSALPNTWRTEKANSRAIAKGDLVDYLNLRKSGLWLDEDDTVKVKDRPDLQDIQGKIAAYD